MKSNEISINGVNWLCYLIHARKLVRIKEQKYFSLQEPQKIVLGEYHKQVRKGRKLTNVLKQDTAYYVPLLQSIQQLLNNDSVLEEVRFVCIFVC